MNLKKYTPREGTDHYVNNVEIFYDGREMVIESFKKKIFLLNDGNLSQYVSEKLEIDPNSLVKYPEYFENFKSSLKDVKESYNVNFERKNENIGLIEIRKIIKDLDSGKINSVDSLKGRYLKNISSDKESLDKKNLLSDSKGDKLKKMFQDFEYALFRVFPPGSDENKKQNGQGLKILTPQQMITRLPILLAQLKAGNNSQKLKNEIRQLLYHLYRSKNLSKTIFNHLINNI